jgi:hypothetical protein
MIQLYEKRQDSRKRLNAPLICQTYLSGSNYHAKKIDHSSTGLSFKSQYDLKPGTIIYIRRECCPQNCPGGKACEGCRTVTLATVKWCQKFEGESTGAYLTGAKYFI